MDKEKNKMKLRSGWILIPLLWGLTACQGHDPFDRESNPVKDYPAVTNPEAAKPYVPGQVEKQPVDPDNTQRVCFEPFKVSINGDQGNRLMTFVEEEARTYRIHVRSFLDDQFTVQAQTREGVVLKEVARNGNTADFDISWTPAKGRSKEVRIELLTLRLSGTQSDARCGRSAVEMLNMVVLKTEAQPTVQFSGTPQNPVTYGESLEFQILANDPAGSNEFPPVLMPLEFRAIARSGEKVVLDASSAVDCTETATQISEQQWAFQCKLETTLIKKVQNYINKDLTVDAALFAQVKSQRSIRKSASTPLYIPINFKKVNSGGTGS